MRRLNHGGSVPNAFTMLELLAIVTVVAVILLIALPAAIREKRKAERIRCVGRLKNIGLSFRIYATDNFDQYPSAMYLTNTNALATFNIATYFSYLSNELSTAVLLHCPADKTRKPTRNFAELTSNNISYFVGLSADESKPQSLLAGDRDLVINGVAATGLITLSTAAVVRWSGALHGNQGNIALGDGSVQQLSVARFASTLKDAGETNLLFFP